MNKAEAELKTLKACVPGPLPYTRSLDVQVTRPRVGCGCILYRSDGKVLIGRRKNSHGEGRWALPGGHLEYGKSFGECCKC